ncbi:cytochrome P450 monooxygenase 23 [Asimina triloba]
MSTAWAGVVAFFLISTFAPRIVSSSPDPQLGSARVVFQILNPYAEGGKSGIIKDRIGFLSVAIFADFIADTDHGDIEFGFFLDVAPRTVDHIFRLVRLGCYNTNHFFRVDRGFVAQVADVVGGRSAPMNEEQRKEAEKTVVGEFSDVKHVRGIFSMGRYFAVQSGTLNERYSDPDSASSSFSILLGDAPHLDGQVA